MVDDTKLLAEEVVKMVRFQICFEGRAAGLIDELDVIQKELGIQDF